MSDNSFVIVFPSVFAKNKLDLLVSNIKNILKVQNQKFSKITKDDSVIVIDANDPVFASSTINLLYGIERVAIAKQVKNEFDVIVSAIAKIGTNLLLSGERFLVKVDGYSAGYMTKDVELAATSSLIEKTTTLGTKPGTQERYDKLIYAYLTKLHGYICIFTDKGHGGLPYNSQNEKIVCCVYDELSAVSCLETIREGFDVKIVICYNSDSNLIELVKILNRILPKTIQSKIDLEFFYVDIKNSAKNIMLIVVVEILCFVAKSNKIRKISLSLSPLIFPSYFVNSIIKRVFKKNFIPWLPLAGLDGDIFDNAKEIGLEKYIIKIEKLANLKFDGKSYEKEAQKIANQAIKTKKVVSVIVGPNNVHDILDSLKVDH
ncbi:MAG: thiamine biosynthesis protein [Nitrosopumilaceae archaeon]|nr:thiamine biosynthesis protein [Nitrosopumilaceae archaeon]